MPSDVGNEKRALRAQLRERRRQMTSTERDASAHGLTSRLTELVANHDARRVACYLSTVDEPTTRPFLQWLHADGRQVLLPVSRDDGLLDWVVSDGTETEGLFGLPEPVGELLGPIAINDVDLIIVPAAAVDQGGMRMGWGRGYFDKTLGSMEACPPVYAVVFDPEFVDELPREKHDMPVDGIVTPTLIHSF
jgi:5-formyltetrahydrofolate cyclo-ligase